MGGTWDTEKMITCFIFTLCKWNQAFLPESPRWMLLSGCSETQISAALRRTLGRQAEGLSGEDRVQRQLLAMTEGLKAQDSSIARPDIASLSQKSLHQGPSILDPKFRRPLFIGTSLMLFQQVRSPIMHGGIIYMIKYKLL